VFLPIYRRLGVFTAYEYLAGASTERRACSAAGLFLLQRGLRRRGDHLRARHHPHPPCWAGAWILVIVVHGLPRGHLHVTGGSEAVSLTQKWRRWRWIFAAW
jgi:hypothetical protein